MSKEKWVFEPGHTAAEFSIRHMMVSNVRGHFKNIEGVVEYDSERPTDISVQATINAQEVWTGENYRDNHLRSADFFDVENHPEVTFTGGRLKFVGQNDFQLIGDLTVRGITREVTLDVQFLGKWQTSFWEDGVDKGPITRAGFVAKTQVNRHDFNVSWNDVMDKGGIVVGDMAHLTIDVEALLMKG